MRALLDPLVPLVEFRHRSWLEEDERADTLGFLERNGLAYVSVDAPRTRASNVVPPVAAATHARGVRPLPRPQREDLEHPLGEVVAALRLDVLGRRARRVGREAGGLSRSEADEVYAMFNNNRDDFAPRSAMILRDLLDRAGIPAAGGIEPPPLAPTLF